jgi:oligopeptide transport system ATP-binding protein
MGEVAAMSEIIMDVKDLRKSFPIKGGVFSQQTGEVKAVEGVSLQIRKGKTVGLVGESGCGKTTVARTMLRLYEKSGGEVRFKGRDIFTMKKEELRRLRPQMQYIFQDPYSSLNPRLDVQQLVGESLLEHGLCKRAEMPGRVEEALRRVGLLPEHALRYPHEFSGGQRQRIGVARALILRPELIVADEPISALDVSIQSQIINLLMDLQEEFGFSYLFISHDLSVVRHISHEVGVMYLGKLVEFAEKKEFYNNPLHPYSQALLSAVPVPDPKYRRNRIILCGDIPSPANPPSGCRFHTRCPIATGECMATVPELRDIGGGHMVACLKVKG